MEDNNHAFKGLKMAIFEGNLIILQRAKRGPCQIKFWWQQVDLHQVIHVLSHYEEKFWIQAGIMGHAKSGGWSPSNQVF